MPSRLSWPDTANGPEMATAREVVAYIAGWLTAVGAHDTAEVYRGTAMNMTNVDTVVDQVRSLRPLLAPYLE